MWPSKDMEENNASKVTIIAMDPKTGDIKAMVKKPDYDPNTPTKAIYPVYEELLEECKSDNEKRKHRSFMIRLSENTHPFDRI